MAPPSQKSPLYYRLGISPELQQPPSSATPSQNPNPNHSTILTLEHYDIPSESDDPDFTEELAPRGGDGENDLIPVQDTREEPPKKCGREQRKQPKELVRTPALSQDIPKWRAINRGVRIKYESLRCYYKVEYITNRLVRKATQRQRDRSDIKASTEMRKLGLLPYLRAEKRVVGAIPGVEIGDIFFYRAELCLLGLHAPIQGGIGYVPRGFVEENEPIAVSVVASGGYQDDKELGEEVFLYTGSGGKGRNDSHLSGNQTLERGNLALERSKHYGIEVRVIHGMPFEPNSGRKLYVYDGLYRVIECIRRSSELGCDLYHFRMLRIQGQDQLGSKTIRIAAETKAKLAEKTVPSGYLSLDLSHGKEAVPVPYFNNVEKENNPMMYVPMMHQYLKSPKYPSPSKKSAMKGCQCGSACSDECSCQKRNGGTFAYDNNRVLLHGRPVVYECGDRCHCPATCPNRVTQKGIRYQLEVFRSKYTQWGVRSLDPIQAGTFICDFSGDVVLRGMVEPGSVSQTDLIDPRRFPPTWHYWGAVSDIFPEWKPAESPALEKQPGYFLDISRRNNVACYISHSESPNAFIQFVLYSHDNAEFPRMSIFAMENIPPLTDITLDYGCYDVSDGQNLLKGE